MAKLPKTQPTEKLTPKQAAHRNNIKGQNASERAIDRSEGRDTRMARDGGTNRRLRS